MTWHTLCTSSTAADRASVTPVLAKAWAKSPFAPHQRRVRHRHRFAVAEHRLTVTHADGFPVKPVEVDTLLLGMDERYDVIVTAKSGAFAIVALPEGKTDQAGEAVLRNDQCGKAAENWFTSRRSHW